MRQTSEWSHHIKQHKLTLEQSKFSVLKATVMQLLGDAHKENSQLDLSLEMYGKALRYYQNHFGNVYNGESVQLLQKIADVNRKLGKSHNEEDCLQLVSKILSTIFGPHHKDILKLKKDNKTSS